MIAERLFKIRLTGSSALAASTILTNLLRIVSTVCLTRLLAPEVYGITGMILSVFYMINMITDIGLQAYVVRHHRGDEPDFLSAVFTIHAFRGVGLASVGVLSAWPLSIVLAKPELGLPLAVASLVFAIDGLVTLHQFRGLRDGLVQRFATIDFVTGISQTVAAISFALVLRNVWAIIASMFVASAMKVWVGRTLFPGSRLVFRRDKEVAADLWKFSRVIAISSALTLVIGQVDKLALARILPLNEFGVYVVAASLAMAPTAFAFNYVAAIVYPAAAAARRTGGSLADAYYRTWGRFFYFYAFAGGGLIGVADLVVRLLYDPRYLRAANYLSILAVSVTLIMLTHAMEAFQVASDRQRVAIEFNLVRLACLVIGGALAVVGGNPMHLVLTIGLLEIPVYLFGLFRLSQLHQVHWWREFSLIVTIVAGVVVGRGADFAALALFPGL